MDILDKIKNLTDDADDSAVVRTAEELRMLSFSPILLIETPNILTMRKSEIITEAERILLLKDSQLPDYDKNGIAGSDDFKQKHLDMLYFYFELITRLRRNEPEAWDYVHELYEDD